MLDILKEREYRIPGSHLFALEVRARIGLQQFDQAQIVFDRGMRNTMDADNTTAQLELLESNFKLQAGFQDPDGIWSNCQAAVQLAQYGNQPMRAFEAYVVATEEIKALEANELAKVVIGHMGEFFQTLSTDSFWQHWRLVLRGLHAGGKESTKMLLRATSM